WQAGLLNGIGGKIEEGESPHSAMVREFEEEAGVKKLSWELFCKLVSGEHTIYFFSCRGDVDAVRTMEEEEIVVYNVNIIHGLDTIPNLKWLVPMGLDKVYSVVKEEV
ncbi:unnamed protein product, partial [marine sediment metagenome]